MAFDIPVTGTSPSRVSEFLFVDPSVPDLDTILGNLRPEVQAVVLDAARPVAGQVANALDGHESLDAVHVIGHGAPGRVSFAAGDWSAEMLEEAADEFAAIGQALAANGDLRLWTCNTGAGMAGSAFVGKLARATGADVYAATKPVGAAVLGGSWEFPMRARCVAPQQPLTRRGLEAYAGLLAGVYRIVSGDVPRDPAENVNYVVVNSRDKHVVGTFSLPGRANIPKFAITITVPSATETYQAGRLDEHGKFIPANFKISETIPSSTGTMNAGVTRHGA